MSDCLSPLEAELIEGHLRDHGATICPPCTFTEDLVAVGSASKESKAVSRRIQNRQKRFQNAGKVSAPSPETVRMIDMAQTMTTMEIGAAVGMTTKAVALRLRRHGVEPVSDLARRRAVRQETVRVLMAQGASVAVISAKTGADPTTIRDDITMLTDRGFPRKKPQHISNPNISQRRQKAWKLRADGASHAEIGRQCRVSVGTVRLDLKLMEEAAHA